MELSTQFFRGEHYFGEKGVGRLSANSDSVGYGIYPYGAERNIICRGDHILAKQVCHEAKRNIESPVTLSALSFCFAQTNGLPRSR